MKTPSILIRRIEKALALAPLVATAWLALTPVPVHAALTDIAPAPLANSSSAVVKPNILMILDDSGSMDRAYMPDEVTNSYCKRGQNANTTLVGCQAGDVAFNASAFNGLYYNPDVTYTPAVNADLTSKQSYNTSALWAVVPNDAYEVQFTGTKDLTQDFDDQVFCQGGSSSSDRTPPYLSGICKHPLPITGATTTWTYPDGSFSNRHSVTNGTSPLVKAPHYYKIASVSWCPARNNLGFGIPGTSPSVPCQAKRTATFLYPMYGAITRTDIAANEVTTKYRTTTVTHTACGENLTDNCACGSPGGGTWRNVRERTVIQDRDIVTRGARVVGDAVTPVSDNSIIRLPLCVLSGSPLLNLPSPNPAVTVTVTPVSTTALSYPKSTSRTDCAGSVGATGCSFTEEMTNFANWYAYYRTRMQLMKTASGLAFKTLNQNYRVGFLTISPTCANTSNPTCPDASSGVRSSKFLAIAPFEGAQRQSWYDRFYAILPGPSTPLREALARAGRYFAGKGPGDTSAASGINRGMDHDPIEYSCQQNFAILSTDGLWNTQDESVGPVSINGTTLVGNPDSTIASAPRPLFDGSNLITTTNTVETTKTQQICTGNAGVLGTNCGCPTGLKRVIQQTVVSTDSVLTPPGGAPTNTSVTTYQTIFPATAGVCDALQVGSQTPQVQTQILFCRRGTTGGDDADFDDGAEISCTSCNNNRGFLVRQTKLRTRSIISYDGGANVTTFSGFTSTSYDYATSTSPLNWMPTKPTGSGGGANCTNSDLSGSQQTAQIANSTPVVPVNTGATVTAANATIPLNTPQTTSSSSSSSTSGTADTLADVAQYYYITDLRGGTDAFGNPTGPATSPSAQTTPPGGDISENNVKGQTTADVQNDSATWQHMTTFTVGLGVDGGLAYASDYRTNPTGDFLLIKNGAANWPSPSSGSSSTVDDLWHAGVNGRGKYLSARDPAQLTSGLSEALASVNAVVGAAAAAATSNLEPVPGDNFVYIASYETVSWSGEVEGRTIDLNTGAVSATNSWSAQGQLDTLANSTTPGGTARKIWRLSPAAAAVTGTGGGLQDFTYANLDGTTEKIYFQASHISGGSGSAYPALSQWASLADPSQRDIAKETNLVNFIRGDGAFEDNSSVAAANRVFRDRLHVLGDIVNAQPVFVKKSALGYTDADYTAFQTCLNTGAAISGACDTITGTGTARPATVYISSNDGMLHALNGDTGVERWAYIPNMLMPKLYRLADKAYTNSLNHQWMADGTPSVGDIHDGTKWRTVLVGGLNGGERGYYALDVTDPLKPIGLWEFKARTTGSCTSAVGDTDDCDLGFSYGNPILTKITNADASTQWVVMVPSGYNNANPGDGKGYLYVLNPLTGVLVKKIALCSAAPQSPSICPGDTTTPMGFAKINNWVDDSNTNNTTLRVYGGDLFGNLWRIDTDTGVAYVIAQLNDGATPSVGQPVTTKPELGQVTGSSGSADMVYVATGKYLGTGDTSSTQKQTVYAIKDATNGTAPVTPIDARGGTVVAQTLADTTDATGAAVRTVTNTTVNVTAAGTNGWRVDLPVTGERVNVEMKLQLGTLIVGSNVPANNSCNSGGFSFLNFFDYRTGSYIPSAGSNIAGQRVGNSLLVGINVVRLPNNKTVAIATTSDNQHPTLYPPFQSPNPVGRRVGWTELQ